MNHLLNVTVKGVKVSNHHSYDGHEVHIAVCVCAMSRHVSMRQLLGILSTSVWRSTTQGGGSEKVSLLLHISG